MSGRDRALLLSVRPRFAESIMAGAKVGEVRRQCSGARPGMPVIIYATKPVGAIVGTATVSEVEYGEVDEMWARYYAYLGIERNDFDAYVSGTTMVCVLLFKDVQRLVPLLTLEQMRAIAAFQPPQSYRYVNRCMLNNLTEGHPQQDSLLTLLSL